MKVKIIRSITTFIITTGIMAATTLNFATSNDNTSKINNQKDYNINSINETKYLGSYSVTNKSVSKFVNQYLFDRNITNKNINYVDEYNLLVNSLSKNPILREDLLGELTYTIQKDKLIIKDTSGGESFVMNYEIKNNILYAKVYNFSEEMALGHFIDNGKYLIINNPSNKKTSIYLEHNLV